MNWLNIELTTLRSEEYLGSDPVQRATWLNLLAYCADQENGGIIKDCRDWGGRRWLQLIGVTSDEVLSNSDLWEWKNNDLRVWNYPKAKELEVKRKREQGRKGGRPPKTKGEKPHGSPDSKPDGSILQKRNRKGKEEEGNRKENKKVNLIAFAQGLVEDSTRKELIAEWMEYKVEIKKPMKAERGVKSMITQWESYTNEQIRDAMYYSMANGYQGIVFNRITSNSTTTKQELF